MVELTFLTIIIEFFPPLVVTLTYLLLFQKNRNKYIEAFIMLMYIKTVSFFLYYIVTKGPYVPETFDSAVNGNVLFWIMLSDFIFQFSTTLQEYLTWIMISFIAVLFGMLVLGLKLALQDPLKMKFSNLIRKITGKEPVSDGYSGLHDRLNNIVFEGIDPNPLDNIEVRTRTGATHDYLIIGLVTIIPSISAYLITDAYLSGVFIFLTWIYRFGYPASNRIAKGAGLKLGDRDIGSEMMRGVLGWFFRLNLLVSLGVIGYDAFINFANGTIDTMIANYEVGLWYAIWPIVFAILLLPLFEDFTVVFYKRTFEFVYRIKRARQKTSIKALIKNAIAAAITGLLVTGAYVGGILGTTLSFSWKVYTRINPFPHAIQYIVINMMYALPNNQASIAPGLWSLFLLLIPLGSMLLLGVLGHLIRNQYKGSPEMFAAISGLIIVALVWILLPGLDYVLTVLPTPGTIDGIPFARLRPVLAPPNPDSTPYIYRLAYQFAVNLPIFIFSALFIMYYLDYRRKLSVPVEERMPLPGEEVIEGVPPIPIEAPSILNISAHDYLKSVLLFCFGIVASILFVAVLTQFIDPLLVDSLAKTLNYEIGSPNGLEHVLEQYADASGSIFLIIAEHNIARTFVMIFMPAIFWSATLWFLAGKKTDDEKALAGGALLLAIVLVIMGIFWTILDIQRHHLYLSYIWTPAAGLGLRIATLFGVFLGAYLLINLLHRLVRGRFLPSWWFAVLLSLIVVEYFVYDDQFTIIALIAFPFLLALFRSFFGDEETRSEDFLITYIRYSFVGIAVAEILSTAFVLGTSISIAYLFTGNVVPYLAGLLPHAVVEIPTFLFAATLTLRILRDFTPDIRAGNWNELPKRTLELIKDERTWRVIFLIIFFFVISGLIEAYISRIVSYMFGGNYPG